MGSRGSKQPAAAAAAADATGASPATRELVLGDSTASLLRAGIADEASLARRAQYAKLRSAYVPASDEDRKKNLIQHVYDEDFESIDHLQALRLPPMVVKELRDGVDREAIRRCTDLEKTMARCLQDKMWTAWKCQKERDTYYKCLHEKKADHELLTEYRWKYNLGTFHGEVIARKNIMKRLWSETFPDREIPHPWVED